MTDPIITHSGRPKSALTREEQETIIIRAASDSSWQVYTDIPSDRSRFKKLADRLGLSGVREGSYGMSWVFPRASVAVLRGKAHRKGNAGNFRRKDRTP